MPRKGIDKAPKDLHAPKRPVSAYFLYAQTRRAALKEENPTWKVTQIAKQIGLEWKELGEDEKKKFSEEATELKTKYDSDVEAYKKTDDYKQYQARLKQFKEEQKITKSSKSKEAKLPKRPKDEHAPKRPPAAYFVFQNERRSKIKEEQPDLKIGEVAKIMGAEWQKLTDEEKQPFADKATELKTKYTEDMEKYKGSDEFKQYQEKLKQWKKECAQIKKDAKSSNNNNNNSKKSKTKSKEESESGSNESGSESDSDSSDSDGSSSSGSGSSDGSSD